MPDFASLIMLAPLPPPVNGQSKNTGVLVDRLRATGAAPKVIRIKPGLGGKRSLILHGRKAVSIAIAAFCLVTNVRHRRRHFYLVADGGTGCLYTASLVLLAYATRHRIFLHHRTFGYLSRLSRVYAWVFPRVNASVHHVFLCAAMATRFSDMYGQPTYSRIVSNAAHVDAPDTPPAPLASDPEEPLVLGLLSNLSQDKGLDDALALLRAARAEGLPVRLRLAGPVAAPDAAHAIAVMQAEVGSALEWVGPAYGDDKTAFYRSLDVFLFPTRYRFEAQPNVVFEAAAYGLPVLAFGRGCIASDLPLLHGMPIPANAEFVDCALSTLRAWTVDRVTLISVQQATWTAAAAARQSACAAFESLIADIAGSHAPGAQADPTAC